MAPSINEMKWLCSGEDMERKIEIQLKNVSKIGTRKAIQPIQRLFVRERMQSPHSLSATISDVLEAKIA